VATERIQVGDRWNMLARESGRHSVARRKKEGVTGGPEKVRAAI
jgi:hypothetical protein